MLNKDDSLNDQVVRRAVNAWEYDAKEFMPFADDLLSRLMSLVDEVDLPETKINLLNTISVIVERMERHVSFTTGQECMSLHCSVDYTTCKKNR